MPKAKLPSDEHARLEAVRQLEILDTESEAAFDQLTVLAAQVCEAPYAALTLIDSHRQWFKSKVGFEQTGMPRDMAFCAHTILQEDPLIVPDATLDERFADNPAVLARRGVRFYAGVPLRNTHGHALGSICVLDHAPRELNPSQVSALETLARHASAQLEERRIVRLLLSNENVRAPDVLHDDSAVNADPQNLARTLQAALLERDQSEVALRRVENELRNARTQLMIGRMAAGVAHDVNNLLFVVLNQAEMIGQGLEADHPQRQRISAIIEAAKRGGTLLHQVLAFGVGTLERSDEVDLPEAVVEFVRVLRVLSHDRVEITLTIESELGRVHVDQSQLGQIVLNLGLNALDAMPDGGELVISLCSQEDVGLATNDPDGGSVMLSMRDNGCGMDEQTRLRALEPFFTTKESGTGLGLATVKDIVDKYGGRLHIESCPGEGTAFEIHFPCVVGP